MVRRPVRCDPANVREETFPPMKSNQSLRPTATRCAFTFVYDQNNSRDFRCPPVAAAQLRLVSATDRHTSPYL